MTKVFRSEILLLWISGLVANLAGFIYTLLANKSLSLSDMGQLGFYTNVMLLISVLSVSLGITTNKFGAKIISDKVEEAWKISNLGRLGVLVGMLVMMVIVLTTSWWSNFFHFNQGLLVVVIISSVFVIMMPLSWIRGGLQAEECLKIVSVGLLIEGLFRIIWSGYFATTNYALPMFLIGIPMSAGVSLFYYWWKKGKNISWNLRKGKGIKLPKDISIFWGNAMIQRVGIALLVTVDVILAKHFLPAELAGVYVLLSLVGKIIFFSSQSFYILTTPILAPIIDDKDNSNKSFLLILSLTIIVALGLVIALVLIPKYSLGILLGERYLLITKYIFKYSVASVLFSITMMLALYDLLKSKYWKSLLLLFPVLLMIILISKRHNSIEEIVNNVLFTAVITLGFYLAALLADLFKENKFKSE